MSRQRVLPSQQSQQPQIPLPPQQQQSSSGNAPFGNLSDGGAPYEPSHHQQQQQQQQRGPRRPRTPPSRDQRAQAQFEYEQQRGFNNERPPSPRSSPTKAPRQPHRDGERERERERDRPPRAARAPQKPVFKVDEEAILKAYHLSTLQPEYWQNTATGEDGADIAMSPEAGPSSAKKMPTEHDEPDPLGLYRGSILSNIPELSKDIKAQIFTQNKGFNPKTFLTHVHPAAGPEDLRYGREKLKVSVESRSGAIQRLVEENFDKFIAIKAATFNVYEEMKLGPLAPEGDYSVADLRESLKLAQSKVDAIWTPILEARLKADRLRSTLGVFERSKFFFTLPGVLSESIASGRYDQFLTSYKKGKYLLDSRPGALLGLPPGAIMTEAQREKHGRVFEKVWGQIERIRDDFKELLIEQLKDPRRDIDGVERNVEILLELDPGSDPVWIFFDTQHASIKQVLERSHASAANKFRDIMSRGSSQSWNETRAATDLQACVLSLGTPASEAVINQAAGNEAWKALADLVHTDCEALLQTVPNFWKVAKAYLDGKYQHKEPNSKNNKRAEQMINAGRRSPTQVRVMTREIINLYISLLSDFFRLSSDTTSPSISQGQQGEHTGPPLPAFVPPQTGALAAGQYLLKILGELSDCTNEIGGLNNLGTDAQNSLKEFMNAVRWRFTDTLCNLWIRDARAFHRLEDWKLDTEDQSRTVYLKKLTAYQRAVARLAYRTSGGNEEATANLFISGTGVNAYSRSIRDQSIPSDFARRIHSAYLDALYLFLDGLVALAFSEPTPLQSGSEANQLNHTNSPLSPALKPEEVNIKDRDVRILLAISNLGHFKNDFIAKIVEQLKMALKVDMAQDSKTLNDVVSQLDKILFEEYIKARSSALKATIESGVLGGMDWYNAPKPTEVRSYIYDALLSLVLVHSQVTTIARSLVARTVGALVEELAKHALQAFSQVQRFGMGGMLQATLEMEFLHQTLNVHVSAAADATLQEIYKIISQAYRPQTGQDGSNGELQRELEQLKLTLTQARRATALQFLCFREKRPSISGRGSASSEAGSRAGSVSSAAGRRQ